VRHSRGCLRPRRVIPRTKSSDDDNGASYQDAENTATDGSNEPALTFSNFPTSVHPHYRITVTGEEGSENTTAATMRMSTCSPKNRRKIEPHQMTDSTPVAVMPDGYAQREWRAPHRGEFAL
jgi:hypothetical protein